MGLPRYLYEQCSMMMCHGDAAVPHTRGFMTPEEERRFAIQALLTAGTLPVGWLNAARGATSLPRVGDVILRTFNSSKGPLDMAAEVQISGRALHLKDIAVFPRGAESLSLGTREVAALRSQLAEEARMLGFDQLRITGTRVSGANPGKQVDVLIDLTGGP